MRPDIFLATIGRGSNGSNALEVTEDRAAVSAESQDNIINRVNNVSQYGPSWHYVPGIGVAGTAYAEVPGSALGDLAFSRASSKTRTNAAGVVETIASNVPPHDYRNADGTLSTFPRLNLEPQRTNSIRNSSMVGAVAGSPGTGPTNWVIVNGGLTQTITSIGTENGLPYIEIRFNGTATGTIALVRHDGVSQITAANGQVWSYTFYAKVISQPSPPLTYSQVVFERTSAGSLVKSGSQLITPTTNLQRFTFTRTLDGGVTVGAVDPVFYCTLTVGQSYDFTIRIAAPQMELGGYATTWVPTTTAAVTRIADVAIDTTATTLIGQTEGTLFMEFRAQLTGANQSLSISNGTTTQRVDMRINTANQFVTVGNFGGSTEFNIIGGTATAGGRFKIAMAYKANDAVLYVNGTQIGTDTSVAVSGTFTRIGFDLAAGTQPFNSPVTEAAVIPTRLPNATLAQMTTL